MKEYEKYGKLIKAYANIVGGKHGIINIGLFGDRVKMHRRMVTIMYDIGFYKPGESSIVKPLIILALLIERKGNYHSLPLDAKHYYFWNVLADETLEFIRKAGVEKAKSSHETYIRMGMHKKKVMITSRLGYRYPHIYPPTELVINLEREGEI